MGRGVTVAYLTFNQVGVGSNPSDPMEVRENDCINRIVAVLHTRNVRAQVRFLVDA